MGDWSMLEGQLVDTIGEVIVGCGGTQVIAGGANTKGNWAELVAATTYDAAIMSVALDHASSDRIHLTDIGIGAADSEQVLIPNLLTQIDTSHVVVPPFPIPIPAGTRIAARTQSATASSQIFVSVTLLSQGFLPSSPLQRVTAYGPNVATSNGVTIDPGAVANTKNAYYQINGAIAAPIRALVVAIGNKANATMTSCSWLVDVATGAAGSETIILPDLRLAGHAGSDFILPVVLGPFFIDIPAGTRLAARAACSITDATDRLFAIALYGID